MLLIPMLVINLLIVAIFILSIALSDIDMRIRKSEVATIQHTVRSRGEQLQSQFNNLNYMTVNMAWNVQETVNDIVPSRRDIADQLREAPELTAEILEACRVHLTDSIKINQASGLFVLLDGSALDNSGLGFAGSQVAGLYFNDADLTSVNANNIDLMLYCGPKQISRDMAIPLNNDWSVEFRLDDLSAEQRAFIDKPFQAAEENRNLTLEQLGYWSRPVARGDGEQVFYYTVPLRDVNNRPYGVVGVELSTDYLRSTLNPAEMGYSDNGFYAITGLENQQVDTNWLVTNGIFAFRYLETPDIQQRPRPEFDRSTIEIDFGAAASATAIIHPLSVYYTGNVFGDEAWCLVAGVDSKALFAEAGNLSRFLLTAIGIAMIVGVFFSIACANLFVAPVSRLTARLAEADPENEIALERTKVKEIDLLIENIEQLSKDLLETANRTVQAIEMTEMAIGFVEVNAAKGRVYLTDYLFDLFGLEKDGESNFIPLLRWEDLSRRLEDNREGTEEDVFLLDFVEQKPFRWLRLRMAADSDRTFGIVIDVTADILEKRRLELERDTDPLTGLYNRHAFFTLANSLVAGAPARRGVMLFADLDNLKYVNDTYGHDFGDRYIRAAATVFGQFAKYGAAVSRISGDEFAIFLHGYETKEELGALVTNTFAETEDTRIALPDGNSIKIRYSIGFSWYPDDSANLEQLLRYADFAMYETKRSVKGSIKEFSLDSYLKNSYLVEKNEDFNQFIERNQVRYAFQPIVDIFSGKAFGYEALMRPTPAAFKSPFQVLQLARTQAKLYQIERMTIFNLFEWMARNNEQVGERRLFINSIANQQLSERDNEEIASRFQHLFDRVVIEITESESGEDEFLAEKLSNIRRLGIEVAIDDFGAGYSNDLVVLNSNPHFIKIDLSLVQDIQNHENKRKLVKNIISYAHPLGIKIIAEGIETEEEAETMIKLGADYLQGYFLARPAYSLEEVPEAVSEIIRGFALQHRDRRRDARDRREPDAAEPTE